MCPFTYATGVGVLSRVFVWSCVRLRRVHVFAFRVVLFAALFSYSGPLFRPRFETDRGGTRALQSSCSCMGSVRVQPDLEIGCVGKRTQTFFTG